LKDKTLTISNDIYPPDENPVIIWVLLAISH
jgi:hypothetical protein